MNLDLEKCRANSGISEEVNEKGALEIGDTDRLHETNVDEVLHRLPGLLDGGLALADLSIKSMPS